MNAPHFKSILLLFTVFLIGSLNAAPTPPLLTTEAAKPVVAPGETNTFKVYLTEQGGASLLDIIITTTLPDASVDVWNAPILIPGQQLLHLIPYTHTNAVVPSIETASSSSTNLGIQPSSFDVKVSNVIFDWDLNNTYTVLVNENTTFDQPAVPSGSHVAITVFNFDLGVNESVTENFAHRVEFYDETVPLLEDMGRIQMFKKPLADVLNNPTLNPTDINTLEFIYGEANFEFPVAIFGDGVASLQLYIYDIDTGSYQGSQPGFSTWRDGVIIYGLDKDGTIIVPATSVSTLNTLSVVNSPAANFVDIYAANGRQEENSSPRGRVTYCFPETPKLRTLIVRYYNQTQAPGNPPITPENQHIWISKLYSNVFTGPIAPDFSRSVATNKALTMYVFNFIQPGDGTLIPPLTVTQPSHGTAVVNPNNSITYTPENGYKGPDSFTYTVIDSNGLSATGTISLNVQSAILLIGGGRCVPTSGSCVQQAQPPVAPPVSVPV